MGTVYGLSDRPRYDLVINLFSGLAANKKEITINGGDQWRPFIHVSDVCNAIVNIIKDKEKNFNGQVINLVSENIQIKKIGSMIKKLYPKTKIKFDDKVNDKRDYKVSNMKAKKLINFKPQYNIATGIKEIVNYTKKNKIKNIFNKKFINILNYKKF